MFDALRRVAGTMLAMAQSRLELASLELGTSGLRLLTSVMIGLGAVLMFAAGLIALSVWLVLMLWGALGPVALLLLAAVYLVGGAILLWWMRSDLRSHPPLLEATIAELRRDAAQLRGTAADRSPHEK
jgi:uncharacterized membrane protein YqjE